MRFARGPSIPKREINRRRIAAAERWRKKQIEKAGLFAAEVEPELPTAEERVRQFDDGLIRFVQSQRDNRARDWIEARRRLRAYPEDEQERIVMAWNGCGQPGDPVSFMIFLQRWEASREERARPPDEHEIVYLSRLADWTPAIDFAPRERLTLHEMQCRGLLAKRANGNLIEFRAAGN